MAKRIKEKFDYKAWAKRASELEEEFTQPPKKFNAVFAYESSKALDNTDLMGVGEFLNPTDFPIRVIESDLLARGEAFIYNNQGPDRLLGLDAIAAARPAGLGWTILPADSVGRPYEQPVVLSTDPSYEEWRSQAEQAPDNCQCLICDANRRSRQSAPATP